MAQKTKVSLKKKKHNTWFLQEERDGYRAWQMERNVNRVAGRILLSDCHRSWLLLDFQPFAAYRVSLVKLPSRQFYIQRLPTILYLKALLLCCDFSTAKFKGLWGLSFLRPWSHLANSVDGCSLNYRLRSWVLRRKDNGITSLIWIWQWSEVWVAQLCPSLYDLLV